MRIEYTASDVLRNQLETLGRTEDVRISASGRRLAIALYHRNTIMVLDLKLSPAPATERAVISAAVTIESPALSLPHGIDFVDDHHLVVANRDGSVVVLPVPAGEKDGWETQVQPVTTMPEQGSQLLDSPGSVCVRAQTPSSYQVLICNNTNHTVSQHTLETDPAMRFVSHRLLLKRWLHIPDGVTVSADGRWIAVSNHKTHSVMLYQLSSNLDAQSEPVAILRLVQYPHGVRFSADGATVLVADAGAPCLRRYHAPGAEWSGAYQPSSVIPIMDQATFLKGRTNPMEGGPKGLDLHSGSALLVTTSEMQPFSFFDLDAVTTYSPSAEEEQSLREEALQQEFATLRTADSIVDLKNSLSWRVTAPLRTALDRLVRVRSRFYG